jgi:hypothetical protein
VKNVKSNIGPIYNRCRATDVLKCGNNKCLLACTLIDDNTGDGDSQLHWSSWSNTLAAEISRSHSARFHFSGLMKEMAYKTKVHTREELLHQIMDAVAYIIYPKIILVWNAQGCALKNITDILNSCVMYLSRPRWSSG